MENRSHVLEINLISAQGLLIESSVKPQRRNMKTYAVAWVDPSTKLRTRVDRLDGQNPTWNDKFLFKVSSQFLFSQTSTVSIEIYAVGIFRDTLIGSVRLFISHFASMNKTPAFVAHLIRSSSGEFFGTLNVGGMVLDGSSGFQQAFRKASGIDYRDLTGKKKHHFPFVRKKKSRAAVSDVMELVILSDYVHDDQSEVGDCDSLTSSSSPPHAALRELSLEGKNNEEDHYGVLTPEKESNLYEEDKEEMISDIKLLEQPPETIDSVPGKTAEEIMVVDNEESVVKIEKDVKMMTTEENKKLREMVEMLMVQVKEQSTVISDLTGRVKNLEKKLSRRSKQRKPHYVKPKSYDGLQGKLPCSPEKSSIAR